MENSKIDTIIQTFYQIEGLNNTLKYEKCNLDGESSLMIVGNVGSGKSTLGSYLLYLYSQKQDLIFDKKNEIFKSKKSYESVTKEIKQIKKQKLTVIDTPGGQDLDRNLSDFRINQMICDFFKKKEDFCYNERGLSGIVFCFMVQKNWRMCKSQFNFLAQILNVFGLCYGYQDFDKCPRISVMFTDLSLFQNQEEEFDFQKDFVAGFKQYLREELEDMCFFRGENQENFEQNQKRLQNMVDLLLPGRLQNLMGQFRGERIGIRINLEVAGRQYLTWIIQNIGQQCRFVITSQYIS
ncbi:P-loop containing nucleoside triphosphate hydrolase [Pseudocohnilembus persalinus]|uniref:p-loop containing nucleoside triphosphate hydrolase n=1 Tax=Pseudocohnilembus persalinus TaxID=266149 RepID=A0A0V0QLX7_PSEPJ|nr:P-loop containing nucleoside triphosphate hydrolase [Pseudocohnilembus persalinus]|eukprot:KRX03178.1 P-loop containing nucleoside triphosphate hydrolase [Pseudocohnilembus persalinus]